MNLRALFLFLVLYLVPVVAEVQTSRLLVFIDECRANFSLEEFAKASSAVAVAVDPSNPYRTLQEIFLEEPFVVMPLSGMEITALIPGKSFSEQREKALWNFATRFGYRYVVFGDESLNDALHKAKLLLRENPKVSSDIAPISLEESTRLYSLMEKIDHLFTTHTVHYWAGRETLLGAVRHGGQLPWENGLYLYVLPAAMQKLCNMPEVWEKAGLVLHHYFKGFYKIYEAEGLPIRNGAAHEEVYPFRYPVADLYVMTLERNGDTSLNDVQDTYVHQSYDFYSHWTHDRYEFFQIKHPERAAFGPITISIPRDAELYLNRVYGSPGFPHLWKRYAFESLWNHRLEKCPDRPGTAMVEVDDFSPAPWDYWSCD